MSAITKIKYPDIVYHSPRQHLGHIRTILRSHAEESAGCSLWRCQLENNIASSWGVHRDDELDMFQLAEVVLARSSGRLVAAVLGVDSCSHVQDS